MNDDTAPNPDSRPAEVFLDPRNLKGLAHPLRLRILGILRENGPATASMLAQRLGESSGATSYHARQLAAFGFIEEDLSKASKRDRWWRACHRSTRLDEASVAGNPEVALLGMEFLRSVAGAHAARMMEWLEALPDSSGAWKHSGTISDWGLDLSPEEARRLEAELEAVVARYPRHDPALPRGDVDGASRFVAVQLQILPSFPEAEQERQAGS